MNSTTTIITVAIVAIFAIAALFARHSEAKAFNGGVCRCCGNKFRLFDMDSQGGRGYVCDNCGNVTWCSYNVDKNFFE